MPALAITQEEYRNGLRNEARNIHRFFFCVLCISIAHVAPRWSSAGDVDPQLSFTEAIAPQLSSAEAKVSEIERIPAYASYDGTESCLPRCWTKTVSMDISFTDGLFRKDIDNEMSCKSTCHNSENCIGVYWGFSTNFKKISCWLQMPTQKVSDSLTNVTHWLLTNSSDDCLSYCWKAKLQDLKLKDGIYQPAAKSGDQCKEMCVNDDICDGVDWGETNKSCFHLFRHRRTQDPIQHWEIVKNVHTHCSKAEEQCMPHCWEKTESPILNFKNGLFKKEIKSEHDCKELCANNQTCTGVYWGVNTILDINSCWFQMPFDVVSESLTNVIYWILSNCTDDCLPYCWLPKLENVHEIGGVTEVGIHDENRCKVKCTYEKNCKGIDFNPIEKECWLVYDDTLLKDVTIDENYDHWEIERNLPMICSSGPGPSSLAPVQAETDLMETAAVEIAPIETAAVETATAPEIETTLKFVDTGKSIDVARGGGGEGSGGGGGNGAEMVDSGLGVGPGETVGLTSRGSANSNCPNHILAITVLAAMMGLCVLIIIGLISFQIARTNREELERNKLPWEEYVRQQATMQDHDVGE